MLLFCCERRRHCSGREESAARPGTSGGESAWSRPPSVYGRGGSRFRVPQQYRTGKQEGRRKPTGLLTARIHPIPLAKVAIGSLPIVARCLPNLPPLRRGAETGRFLWGVPA